MFENNGIEAQGYCLTYMCTRVGLHNGRIWMWSEMDTKP